TTESSLINRRDAIRLCAVRRAQRRLPTCDTAFDRVAVFRLLRPPRRLGRHPGMASHFEIPNAHAPRARMAGFRLPKLRRNYRAKRLTAFASSGVHLSPSRARVAVWMDRFALRSLFLANFL